MTLTEASSSTLSTIISGPFCYTTRGEEGPFELVSTFAILKVDPTRGILLTVSVVASSVKILPREAIKAPPSPAPKFSLN